MRFGCCISRPDQLAVLEAAGFDYCEVSAATMTGLGDHEFEAAAERFKAGPVRAEAANVFLPGDMRLTGPDASRDLQDEYVARCMDRLERLGVRIVVFGSGKARNIPEGFSRDQALDQLEDFMRRAAAEAAAHGVTLALEPLQKAESNVFTSVREGAAFLRERGLDDFRLLADLYHMAEDGEDMDAIDESADLLSHAHVADGTARRAPGQGDYDIEDFLRHLQRSGYTGNLSIECRWQDFAAEAAPGLAHLRQLDAVASGHA
jgi:sugar phosphate isomerase/epimerase